MLANDEVLLDELGEEAQHILGAAERGADRYRPGQSSRPADVAANPAQVSSRRRKRTIPQEYHSFVLVACCRLAGVHTQVDMSRLTGSKSTYRGRHKQGHVSSGLNDASQYFEEAERAVVR